MFTPNAGNEAVVTELLAKVAAIHAAVREMNKHLGWVDDKLYELSRKDMPSHERGV